MTTIAEQECVIVMNRGNAEDGKGFMVSSTWPTWTRFFDQLVKAGLAEIEHEITRDGRREGANYLVRADAIRVARKRRVTITPERRAQMAERGRALARNTRSSPRTTTPSRAPRTSPSTEGSEGQGRGRTVTDWRESFHEFAVRVADRLERGEGQYPGRTFELPASKIIAEVQDERFGASRTAYGVSAAGRVDRGGASALQTFRRRRRLEKG